METTALITALFNTQSWMVHDVDDAGRVLAGNNASGSMQVYEIGADGTSTQLTDLPGPVSAAWYIPGSRRILLAHDTGGDERLQMSLLDLDREAIPAGLDALTTLVHDERYIHLPYVVDEDSVIYGSNRRNGRDFDVFERNLATGEEALVYDGGGWPAGAEVSHDRRSIALLGPSLLPSSSVITLVADGRVANLTDPDEAGAHDLVGFTPDDAALLIASDRGRDRSALFRVSRDGREWTELRADGDADLVAWGNRAGDRALLARRARGAATLTIIDADGADVVSVDCGPVTIMQAVWAPGGEHVAITYSTPTSPAAIARIDAATGRFEPVADGAATMDPHVRSRLGGYEFHEVPARDGERIPVFLLRAPGDPLRGATVVHVHGGPESEARQSFNLRVQALLLAGFNVVVPNVRGSDGYGRRWLSMDDVDLRLESVADLADIHAWLPSVGLDPERAALFGGSYGGYMTLAGVAMQPELWAAGVDIVGMSSLVTFLENTSEYRRAFREREYGSLERDRDLLVRASPLTYLDQMRAPLFIIHGANDPRVPLSEAQQIADAYAGKGIRHELMVFPDEGHGLAKRANQLRAYPAAIEFLRDVLGPGAGD